MCQHINMNMNAWKWHSGVLSACVHAFVCFSNVYAYLQFYYIVFISIDLTILCTSVYIHTHEWVSTFFKVIPKWDRRQMTNAKWQIRHKQKEICHLFQKYVRLWMAWHGMAWPWSYHCWMQLNLYSLYIYTYGCCSHWWSKWEKRGERGIGTWTLMFSLLVCLVDSLGKCEMFVKSSDSDIMSIASI